VTNAITTTSNQQHKTVS